MNSVNRKITFTVFLNEFLWKQNFFYKKNYTKSHRRGKIFKKKKSVELFMK